jgi:hypothetical protein
MVRFLAATANSIAGAHAASVMVPRRNGGSTGRKHQRTRLCPALQVDWGFSESRFVVSRALAVKDSLGIASPDDRFERRADLEQATSLAPASHRQARLTVD